MNTEIWFTPDVVTTLASCDIPTTTPTGPHEKGRKAFITALRTQFGQKEGATGIWFRGDLINAVLGQLELELLDDQADPEYKKGLKGTARALLIKFGGKEEITRLSLPSTQEDVIDGSCSHVEPHELPRR